MGYSSNIDTSKFIGVPFVNGGRDFSGCDCWGMVRLVFQEYGIEVPDYKIHCMRSKAIGLQVALEMKASKDGENRWERVNAPEEPCLVLMEHMPDIPGYINHLGVYVGGGKMIHTCLKQNCHIDSIDNMYWQSTIRGFYRWKQ